VKNKIIQGLWIGGRLSLLDQLSLKSFMANGHEYHLYVYNCVQDVPTGVIVKDANNIIPESEIYRNIQSPSEYPYLGFSDYFRVKLIYDKGGFWADTDIICLKQFDFQDDYVFSSEISNIKMKDGVASSLFRCPKNSIFLKEMYNEIHSNPLKKTDGGNILNMFPEYIKKYGFENYLKEKNMFSIYDNKNIVSITNKKYDENFYAECYSVHLLRQLWACNKDRIKGKKDGIKKQIMLNSILDINKIYSEKTPYGFWQRKYL